jgi:hypothetical protein
MRGPGTVTAKGGQTAAVRYELHVYQDEIPCGTLDRPLATIPGLKAIQGMIEPVCFFGENGLLLTMQDGRKQKFFFTDEKGSVCGSGAPSM